MWGPDSCAAMQESVLYAATSVLRVSLMKIVKGLQAVIRLVVQVCCDIYKHRWVPKLLHLALPVTKDLQSLHDGLDPGNMLVCLRAKRLLSLNPVALSHFTAL